MMMLFVVDISCHAEISILSYLQAKNHFIFKVVPLLLPLKEQVTAGNNGTWKMGETGETAR